MRFTSRSMSILVGFCCVFAAGASGQVVGAGVALDADLLGVTGPSVDGLPAGWRVRAVRGFEAPSSQIVDSGGQRFLRIGGTKRAAWFVNELRMPLSAGTGTLHWTWRVPLAPVGASAQSSATDDAALRVFVVFERHTRFARTPRALFYTLGVGEPALVPTSRGPMVSINAGRPDASRSWVDVSANPGRDYQRIWGGDAPRIVAVGVMQDTDQTMRAAIGDMLQLEWRKSDAPSP